MKINDQVVSLFPGEWVVFFENEAQEEVFATEVEARTHLSWLCNGRTRRSRRTQNNSRKFRCHSASLN